MIGLRSVINIHSCILKYDYTNVASQYLDGSVEQECDCDVFIVDI